VFNEMAGWSSLSAFQDLPIKSSTAVFTATLAIFGTLLSRYWQTINSGPHAYINSVTHQSLSCLDE